MGGSVQGLGQGPVKLNHLRTEMTITRLESKISHDSACTPWRGKTVAGWHAPQCPGGKI